MSGHHKFGLSPGFQSKNKSNSPSYSSSYTSNSSQGFSPSVHITGGGNPGSIGGSASVGGSYTTGSTTISGHVGTAGRNFTGEKSGGFSIKKLF
jgi:hypothetical protein